MVAQTAPVPEENAEEIIDLTELIERGDAVSAPEAAADFGTGAGNEDAEIEALLAQMDVSDSTSITSPGAQGDAPAQTPKAHVDPNEQLDMSDMGDIDDLLASLDIPAQPHPGAPEATPAEATAPSAAAPGLGDDLSQDLDAAMNELLAGVAHSPAPAAPKAPTPPAAPAQAAPAQAAPKAATPPAPAPEPAPEPAASAASPTPDAMLRDLDAAMEELLSPAPTPPSAAPAAPEGAPSVDDLLAAAAMPQAAAAASEMEADLDALLGEQPQTSAQAASEASAPPIEPQGAGIDADIASLLNSLDAEPAPQAVAPDSDGPADDILAASATVVETEAALNMTDVNSISEVMPEMPLADEAAPVTEPLEVEIMPQDSVDLPDEHTPAITTETANELELEPQEQVAAVAAASQSMPERTEDFAALATALGERLRQCEADLAAARERIEALENSSADSISLGDLLREGSPLHNGFAALIASSVSQALKDTPPPVLLPETVETRLDGLETRQKSILVRMDALEGRLDNLEPRFNEEVGKAAASAVARILREEISRLAQG